MTGQYSFMVEDSSPRAPIEADKVAVEYTSTNVRRIRHRLLCLTCIAGCILGYFLFRYAGLVRRLASGRLLDGIHNGTGVLPRTRCVRSLFREKEGLFLQL